MKWILLHSKFVKWILFHSTFVKWILLQVCELMPILSSEGMYNGFAGCG